MSSHGDKIALANEFVRTLCGSGVHGMAIEGTDDRDEMGVYIESPAQVLGLDRTKESYVYRTKADGERSGPGDMDLVIYGLRKYMKLAVDGNPTVLTLLYAPDDALIVKTPLGDELREMRDDIVCSRAGWRFLGYLDGQRERMTGGGNQARVPNRPELIEAFGYDTKYASHAVRLGLQGIELMTTGQLTLPMPPDHLEITMQVKRGEVDFIEALRRVDAIRERLAGIMVDQFLLDQHLRPEPNKALINNWMIKAHQQHWKYER